MLALRDISATSAIGSVLLIVAVVTVEIGAKSTRVDEHTNVCFNRTNGRERDVTDCNRYISCNNGRATVVKCPKKQLYSHVHQECQASSEALTDQCFSCSNATAFSDTPVDFQCHQYVRCFLGRPEQRVCSAGTLFDPATETCNLAERVQCGCPQVDRPQAPWFIRDRQDCSRFGVCAAGYLISMQCPPDLYFNQSTNQCEIATDEIDCSPQVTVPLPTLPTTMLPTTTTKKPNKTTTTKKPNKTTTKKPDKTTTTVTASEPNNPPSSTDGPTTAAPSAFRCRSNASVYFAAHPTDCRRYYLCTFGLATERVCPQGSLFDEPTRSCFHRDHARCHVRSDWLEFDYAEYQY